MFALCAPSLTASWAEAFVLTPFADMTTLIRPAATADAPALADLRVRAMRASLEAVGRFDPDRARARFLDSFDACATWHIVHSERNVGVLVLRRYKDHLLLDHLYIEPSHQGAGLGARVLAHVFAEAARQDLPVRVGALKESRSNAFYFRHGFRLVGSTEWDHHYVWHPAAEALGSVVRR